MRGADGLVQILKLLVKPCFFGCPMARHHEHRGIPWKRCDSSTELAQNLRQVLSAIQSNVLPLEQQARELAALSEDARAERLKNLSKLPFVEQVRIKRLIAEFSMDGKRTLP
jgi:hypothetical protein